MNVIKSLIKNRAYIIITYIGVAIFLLGSTFAMTIKPKYSFSDQWLSDLGTGKYAVVFNTTLILSGALTSSFYPLTFYLLRERGYSKKKSSLGMVLGVTSFLFLILVGIFSLDRNLYQIHTISAILFVVTASITQLMLLSGFTWYFCSNLTSSSSMDNKLSYTSLSTAIFFGFIFVGRIDFEQRLLQKLTIYLLIITVIYQSFKVWQSEDLFKNPQNV